MGNHVFKVKGKFEGGLSGTGSLKALGFESVFSAPAELKGAGVGTNPEELLAGAAAGCFLISTAAAMQFQGLTAMGFKIRTEVEAEVTPKIRVTELRHFLEIAVSRGTPQETQSKILLAAKRAEQFCLISQAIKSNVEIKIEVNISEKDL